MRLLLPLASMRLLLASLPALVACQDSDVSRAVGARCDRSDECEDRCLGPSPDWPGGFCSLTCDSDNDCPSDAVCIDEGDSGVCAYVCFADAGCVFLGGGYTCKERDLHPVEVGKAMVCRG